jgi:hypothetical protein
MTGEPRPRVLIVADEAALQSVYGRYFRDCDELAFAGPGAAAREQSAHGDPRRRVVDPHLPARHMTRTAYLVKPFELAARRACLDAAG